jgi:hypothetical protein
MDTVDTHSRHPFPRKVALAGIGMDVKENCGLRIAANMVSQRGYAGQRWAGSDLENADVRCGCSNYWYILFHGITPLF